MTAEDLKKSILQQAIQGKLVPQNPDDAPASILLDSIRVEKARLVADGKIKRDKNESVIFRNADCQYFEYIGKTEKDISDEIPFEIPESWEWVRFGMLSYNYDYMRVPLSVSERSKLDKTYDYYGASGVIDKVDNFLFERPLLLIGEDGANLINRSTPIAFIAIGKYWVNNHAHVLDFYNLDLMRYVSWYINAIPLTKYVTGTAQPKMNQEKMNSILVSLPPLAEQKRIVAKIEELMPIVDEYGIAQSRMVELNSSLGDNLRKSVLQYAIQGKLVPQNPTEEPAYALLDRIRAEKARLIAEGKIKRDKNVSVIYRNLEGQFIERIGKTDTDISDKIPFEIPDSWEWVRGKSVFNAMESTKPSGEYFTYIDIDAVNNSSNKIQRPKTLSSEKAPSRATRKLHEGDILFSMVRPYLRNIALVEDKYKNAIASTGFYVVSGTKFYDAKFLLYLLLSPYVVDGLNQFMKGENSPSINNSHIENYLYPLPPIEEQKRIVERIEQILSLYK